MLAPQNKTSEISDVLDGSLTSWYDSIDDALKSSECVPGYYEYVQAPSYGNQCPITENGSTQVDISCNRFEVLSLENSYIDFNIKIPIVFNQFLVEGEDTGFYQSDDKLDLPTTYYIGYKSVFDIIKQYRIYSNGDLIYTQNDPNYESFINYISLTDTAKENSDYFATYDKIHRGDPNVPGVYVDINELDQNVTLPIEIHCRLPLNMFPLLANLKWYPGFMGRLTIEIYPSYENLVYAVLPNITSANQKAQYTELNYRDMFMKIEKYKGDDLSDKVNSDLITRIEEVNSGFGFSQINTSSATGWRINKFDEVKTVEVCTIEIDASTSTLTKFHLYKATYMIKMDVYNALEMKYLQVPLLFPIQTISKVKFTDSMRSSTHFTLQNTATLSHCDTIFVVFPRTKHNKTCFYNPHIEAHLNIDGKYYPRETVSTGTNDPRFYNLALDSININNNGLISPSKDVKNSLMPYQTYIMYGKDENNNVGFCKCYVPVSEDVSNFFFGVPLSTDEDFMGGISSNGSTVQIELIGKRNSLFNLLNNYEYTEAPDAIFLEDKFMKIYSMKPAGMPQISITAATLEQIYAGSK